MLSEFIISWSLAYFLGSIPFALVIALPQGVDPRKAGSGNPGATNVARLLGKWWGFLTFLGDAGKGILALILVRLMTSQAFTENPTIYAGVAFFAVLGHLFPIFLKFRGGKGVATTIGTFIILTPKALLLTMVIFFVAVYFSGYVSLGSILAVGCLPLLILLFKYPYEFVFCTSILAFLIIIKHKENIKRLLKGQEKTWKKEKSI